MATDRRRALVLGAGAVGLSCAYFLRRAGWEVEVLDSGAPGHGATCGTAGLLCAAHSHPLPGPGVLGKALRWSLQGDSPFRIRWRADPALVGWLLGFARACTRPRSDAGFTALAALSGLSLTLFEDLLDRGEVDFYYERRGGWLVYLTEAGFAAGQREAEQLRAAGFPAEALDGDAAREREPAFSGAVLGALFLAGDAHGLSLGFAESMVATLRRMGVRIETGARVEGLLRRRGAVVGALTRRVAADAPPTPETAGVADGPDEPEGEAEERPAEETVLALGAWSPRVARTVGVHLPVIPAKGYSATIRRFPGTPSLAATVAERKAIVTPLQDKVRFAGTLELAGFERRLDLRRYRAVIEGARLALRASAPLEDEVPWYGFRPLTPDSLPFIGRPPGLSGLLVATGHGMLGFTQSLGTGRLVAELAEGSEPGIPLRPYAVGR